MFSLQPATRVFRQRWRTILRSFITLILVLLLRSSAQSQTWSWANAAGGAGLDEALSIVTDAAGNSYIAGYYAQDAAFGGTTLINSGMRDIFIAKYDRQGTLLWVKRAGGTGMDSPTDIALDASGSVYVCGAFAGTCSFGTDSLTTTASSNYFVAKYSSGGSLLWVKQGGSSTVTGAGAANTITVDNLGNIVVAGNYGSLDAAFLGSTVGAAHPGVFVSKYTPSGALIWGKAIPCTGNGYTRKVAVDRLNNIFMTGFFTGSLDYGNFTQNGTSPTSSTPDLFLTKFDSTGTTLWSRIGVGTSNFGSDVFGLAADYDGNIYQGGYFWSGLILDTDTVRTVINNQQGTFLSRYSPTGTILWVKKGDGINAGGYINGLALDDAGTVYASGDAFGLMHFDSANSYNFGGAGGAFVAQYRSNGDFIRVDASSSSCDALSLDIDHNIYTCGIIGGSGIFGSITLTDVGSGTDAYIAKLGAPGNISKVWNKSFGGSGFDRLRSGIPLPGGQFLLAGASNSPISGDKTQASRGGIDYWITRIDSAGNKLWDKTYGGSSEDELITAMASADGGYLLCGHSYSGTSGDKSDNARGDLDYWVVKVDSAGNKLWDKTYGGSGEDRLITAIPLPDGGGLLGGRSFSGLSGDKSEASRGGADGWLVRFDAHGNLVWDKTLGGSGTDEVDALIVMPDGRLFAGATSSSPVSGDKTAASKGGNDFWIVGLDTAGHRLWDKTIGGSNTDVLTTINPVNSGGFVLTGRSVSPVSPDKSQPAHDAVGDWWVVRTDTAFNRVWDKTLGSDTLDWLSASYVDGGGSVYLAGYSYKGVSFEKSEANRGKADFWLAKLDSSGNKVWDKVLGGAQDDQAQFILGLSNHQFLCGGYSNSNISGDKSQNSKGSSDFWIVRLSDNTGGADSAAGLSAPISIRSARPPALLSAARIRIFPNPTRGAFRIDLDGSTAMAPSPSDKIRVVVTDISGRVLYERSFPAGSRSLPMTGMNLAAGVYLLTIYIGPTKPVTYTIRKM